MKNLAPPRHVAVLMLLMCAICHPIYGHSRNYDDTLTLVQLVPLPIEFSYDSVWDLRNVKDSLYSDVYLATNQQDTNKRSVSIGRSKYHFLLINDSLYCQGYENATTFMDYHTPLLMFTLPMEVGQHYGNVYSGVGEYCHLLPIKVAGAAETIICAKGTLLLPDSKIDSVYQVLITQDFIESAIDTTHFISKLFMWISPHYSYPLLEHKEISAIVSNDTISHRFTYYYAVEGDTINPEQEKVEEAPIHVVDSGALSNVRFLPNPVVDNLIIAYNLTRTAKIHFSLHTMSGLPLYSTQPKHKSAGEYIQQIEMAHLAHGDYVLYIYADDIVLSETIIKI